MEKILLPFSRKRKISLDIHEGVLGIIDKLAKLSHTSRSAIIISLFNAGIYPLFRQLESSWQMFLRTGLNKKERIEIEKLIRSLRKIEIESGIHQYYLTDGKTEDLDKNKKFLKKHL